MTCNAIFSLAATRFSACSGDFSRRSLKLKPGAGRLKSSLQIGRIASFVLFVLATACADPKAGDGKENQTPENAPAPEIELQTFRNENGGWGYDIYVDKRLYIRQPEMPAVGGGQGFEGERQAQRVGELVVEKIKRGILPPSVSVEEVKEVLRTEGTH